MSTEAEIGTRRWRVLASAMVTFFAVGMMFFAVPPLGATLRATFGLSNLAIGDVKAAASDLDDAVTFEPSNVNAWNSRGLAYERLGDKEKAAGSYAKALNIRQDFDPAKQGFARVGGQYGQSYQTFSQ